MTVAGYFYYEFAQVELLINLCKIHENLNGDKVEHYFRNHKVEEKTMGLFCVILISIEVLCIAEAVLIKV